MIRTESLVCQAGSFALRELSLDIAEGSYFVLLGPPGSGKTVLLECLCGLRRVTSGRMYLSGRDVTREEPRDRQVGYVPQDYALFPHLSVEKNIRFGLRGKGLDRRARSERTHRVAEMLGVRHLLSRRVGNLSGGERQRVALARALAIEPRVFLLDEPVSSLDERTRDEVCGELRAIQRRAGATTLHVCHSFTEMLRVADRAGVMHEGRLVQTGAPRTILEKPQNRFVAEFVRARNIARGRATREGNHSRIVCGPGVELFATEPREGPVECIVRPENVALFPPATRPTPGVRNDLEGRVVSVRHAGEVVEIAASIGDALTLVAAVSHRELRSLPTAPGAPVRVCFEQGDVHLLERDDTVNVARNRALEDKASAAPHGSIAVSPPKLGYSHLFRMCHWILGLALPLLVVTGAALHATARPPMSLAEGVLPPWLPGGRIPWFHLLLAPFFAGAWLPVAFVYVRFRTGRYRGRLRRLANEVLLVGGGVSILSALPLLHPGVPPALYAADRLIHTSSGLVILPLGFLLHVVLALGPYRSLIIPSFHPWGAPRWLTLFLVLTASTVSTHLALGSWPVAGGRRELRAGVVSETPEGPDAACWDEAPALRVPLANGVGFRRGRTDLVLRALHDGREIFILAEWQDPAEDLRYLPWLRSATGWDSIARNRDDEQIAYEDKMSLVFPSRPGVAFARAGCAAHCHLGGGRAYGYKGSEEVVDVWHWKSVRTDPVGTADDKYWQGFDLDAEDVGRHGDPSISGGYEKNQNTDRTAPLWLPADPRFVRRGGILGEGAVECTAKTEAAVRPGTEVPGIVIRPVVGDRGDVRSASRYREGTWRVLLRRDLDTGSAFDVALRPGGRYPFAAAVFDHSAKRHAYNYLVYWLVLEPIVDREGLSGF